MYTSLNAIQGKCHDRPYVDSHRATRIEGDITSFRQAPDESLIFKSNIKIVLSVSQELVIISSLLHDSDYLR